MTHLYKDLHFLLFPTCVVVKGYSSSLIMDLDKGAFIEIPNLLQEILSVDLKQNNIKEIKSVFDNKYDEGIDKYFQFLVDKEYGFFTKDPSPFRKPEEVFYSPYKVISSILEYNKNSTYNISKALKQLEALSCQLIQIRLFDHMEISQLSKHLDSIKESDVRRVEILLPMNEKLDAEEIKVFANHYPRTELIVYGCNSKKRIKISENPKKEIIYTTEVLNKDSKEIYSIQSFIINHQMYYEALQYNTGLHRKVCVDTNGNIKNYVSHQESYGNISQNKIEGIIKQKSFQEKYHMHNDMIEKCKDCQFRYMCLSNSDITYSQNNYYKEESCNYDPYTNSWN